MLCDTPLGNIWTNMDSAEKTLKTGDWEQIKVSPKSNLLKQGVLLVLITGHSGQFQEQKWLLQDSCITKDHPSMGDNSWKLETYSVLPSLQEALLGWRVSFPGSSIDLSLLQAAQQVSASFGQLSLCKSVSQPVLTAYMFLVRGRSRESCQLQELPEVLCFLSLMSIPAEWNVSLPLGSSYCFTSL